MFRTPFLHRIFIILLVCRERGDGIQEDGHEVMSGGLKVRNTEWTLMSALTKVCERLAVNFGFEFPPIGMNEVSLSLLGRMVNMHC